MAVKHLPLDHDVYLLLKTRSQATGLPMRHIGNRILRCYLSAPPLGELLRAKGVPPELIDQAVQEQRRLRKSGKR